MMVGVDLANVYAAEDRKTLLRTLCWGDEVEVVDVNEKRVHLNTTTFETEPDGSIKPVSVSGFVVPSASSGVRPSEIFVEKGEFRGILKVDFVDVQQGDASVLETPGGKAVLIDGGDNQLFARYLANRYRGTTEAAPREVECILVSHGDADHFAGLVEIKDSENHELARKRLFIRPKRVYHNGLVKRPSGIREVESLGLTATEGDTTVITELETDLLAIEDAEMNAPFVRWKRALAAYHERHPVEFRRLQKGDGAEAFSFLADEGIEVEVLGPIPTLLSDGMVGLKFLGEPAKGPRVGHHSLLGPDSARDRFTGKSASHTINGHSVVLRVRYGAFKFLFAGDLNEESETELAEAHGRGELDLRSEVLKVPHHGSHDFLPGFMGAVSPVVSVVSSGDESARTEYIHPRATLMGALGRHSRVEEPLIFVTELVAFFERKGWVRPEFHEFLEEDEGEGAALVRDGRAVVNPEAGGPFYAFERTAFGLVRVRTDGERLLVFTNSGQVDLKEAYAYRMAVDAQDNIPVPDTVVRV
jgi:beta-lactamase superfamily II metal-dependent hydrolase